MNYKWNINGRLPSGNPPATVRDYLDRGWWPAFDSEGPIGVNLDNSFIPYCSGVDDLSDQEGFRKYLLGLEPLLVQGENNNPYWMVSFPKQIYDKAQGDRYDCFPEKLRMNTLMGTFKGAHSGNMREEYDTASFQPIIDGSNPTAIGVGIFTLDENGSPKCVATSDVKTGAHKAYEYEQGGEGLTTPKDYLLKYLKENLNYEFDGNPLTYHFENESELGKFLKDNEIEAGAIQSLFEQRDGDFVFDAESIVVPEGQLPVHTLLSKKSESVLESPQFEIGQLANSPEFNGVVAAIIAGGLLQIYDNLTSRNHNVKVGFSISPDFLESIKKISNDELFQLISLGLSRKRFMEYGGVNVRNIIIEKISQLKNSIHLFPLKDSRVMVVKMLDGSYYLAHGVMQGDTVEVPAYIKKPN